MDQAEALGRGQEGTGRDQLAALALHPQQQLAVFDLAGRELENRLEVQYEAVVIEGVLNPLRPGQLGHRPRPPRLTRRVDDDAVAPGGLGGVHGQIGVDHHLAGGRVV